LEEKTGVRYYVLYYEVDYYIPKEDKTKKRDRAHFKQAVLQGMETSLNEKTVVLMVPFFRSLAEVKEKGKMTTKLKSFGFPQLYKGGSLPEALQQTFTQYKKGDVYNLALGLYRDIPKPHYVYAQYFRADGAILYTKVEEPKKVAGYKSIYEFHFYLDQNLKKIKKLYGTRRSKDLIEELKKGPPSFQRVVHKIREYAISEGHMAFSYNYVYKDYSALMDYMRGVARPKENLPKEAFIIPPKEADLIENVLDFSSFFLSFVGLDIVPEAIGFVYNAARDNDQGKLKYLAGIALVGPSGFMNKISWKSIKSFVKGLGGYAGLRKKFSASIAGQLDNKFLKKIDLDDAFRKDEDLLKKLDEDLVTNPSLIKEFNQKPVLIEGWVILKSDKTVSGNINHMETVSNYLRQNPHKKADLQDAFDGARDKEQFLNELTQKKPCDILGGKVDGTWLNNAEQKAIKRFKGTSKAKPTEEEFVRAFRRLKTITPDVSKLLQKVEVNHDIIRLEKLITKASNDVTRLDKFWGVVGGNQDKFKKFVHYLDDFKQKAVNPTTKPRYFNNSANEFKEINMLHIMDKHTLEHFDFGNPKNLSTTVDMFPPSTTQRQVCSYIDEALVWLKRNKGKNYPLDGIPELVPLRSGMKVWIGGQTKGGKRVIGQFYPEKGSLTTTFTQTELRAVRKVLIGR